MEINFQKYIFQLHISRLDIIWQFELNKLLHLDSFLLLHKSTRYYLSKSKLSATNTCDSNPCLNGATCVGNALLYVCSCPTGYTGTNCESSKRNVQSSIIKQFLTIPSCHCLNSLLNVLIYYNRFDAYKSIL